MNVKEESEKVGLKLNSKRGIDVQNSLMDSVGEGEGGKIWENGIETCKISCMKREKKK